MMAAPVLRGKAWVFGDEINTDTMAPGSYFKDTLAVMAQPCREDVDPEFACTVQQGAILVSCKNIGVGSAHQQAPMSLVPLG